ncbi:hypothetical protein REPUB_Repub12eG0083100 [Reevesia pubescens]
MSNTKALHKLSKDDILALKFDTVDDAFEFYKAYATIMGFGLCKGSSKRDRNEVLVMKHFACLKEGHRVEKWEKLENRMREPKRTLRNTFRCEVINAFIASLTKENKTLLEFVRALEDGIKNVCNNELEEDYITMHTEPITSHPFKEIEKHAVNRISSKLTMNRWTQKAKADAPAIVDQNVESKYTTMLHYALLNSNCSRLCYVASQLTDNKARSEIASLTSFISSNTMDDEIDLDNDDSNNAISSSQIGTLFCDDSSELLPPLTSCWVLSVKSRFATPFRTSELNNISNTMKHVLKIFSLLLVISSLWIGLLQASIIPRSHIWLLPIYFIVSLGCYGLLMVGVGLIRFPTCPQEALLLQQDIA